MEKSISLNFIVKKGRVLIFSFILLGLAFVSAHATLESDVSNIYSILNNSSYGQYQQGLDIDTINRTTSNIYSDIHQYLPDLNTIKTYLYTIQYDAELFRTDFYNTTGKWWRVADDIRTATQNTASTVVNLLPTFDNRLLNIQTDTRQLADVLANATDAAIRADQEARVAELNDGFLSSSGSASMSTSDIGSAKDSVSNLKNSLSGGASASSLWDVLTSGSSAWGWFSQATANDLDTSGSASLMSEPQYTFLNAYYQELGLSLGGDYND